MGEHGGVRCRGLHALGAKCRGRIRHKRDVITKLHAKARGRFNAAVCDQSDQNDFLDTVLLQLCVEVGISKTALRPVFLDDHVTWLRPADEQARPDASEPADRSRFFDEVGRWLGAYMYGQVRDQLL